MAGSGAEINVDEVQQAFGVRRPVAEEMAEALTGGGLGGILTFAFFMVVMCGGFVIGGLWLWPRLSDLASTNLLGKPEAEGALLYETLFGIGMLFWIFAWMLVTGVVSYWVVAVAPLKNRLGFAMSAAGMNNRGWNWRTSRMIRRLAEDAHDVESADEYAKRWLHAEMRQYGSYALPLFLVGLVSIGAELEAGSLYTPSGYIRDPYGPWNGVRERQWSEAQRVQLGCNQTDDGSSLIYVVHFNDTRTRVSSATPLGSEDYLAALETVDAALRQTDAVFERWVWLERNPLHPQCVAFFSERYGPERVERLLRVGAFRGDPAR